MTLRGESTNPVEGRVVLDKAALKEGRETENDRTKGPVTLERVELALEELERLHHTPELINNLKPLTPIDALF